MSKQTFQFDKFMKDLEERSQKETDRIKEMSSQEEHWHARELQRRYREHPHNRIRVDPKE